MQKKIPVNGDLVRKEREKRAWTQEELSDSTRLGVRTLRRLEAGHASLETLRRVSEALDILPETTVPTEIPESFSLLSVEIFAANSDPEAVRFAERLTARVSSIRRHLALKLGFVLPPVRILENPELPRGGYRILVRELPEAEGKFQIEQLLAVGPQAKLAELPGPLLREPTYGMPAKWLPVGARELAQSLGLMLFDNVSLVATHLTEIARTQAHRLLGIEAVAQQLETLQQPHLLAEVVRAGVSLATLRRILCNLLKERVSIRDLGLILETLADCAHPHDSSERLTETVRIALGPVICREHLNGDGQLWVVRIDSCEDSGDGLARARQRGVPPILLCPAALRRELRERVAHDVVVLSESEIPDSVKILEI